MQRATPDDYRPVWLLAFYDQAELHSLALSAHLSLDDCPTAEFHTRRGLAGLRPHVRRSRAITMTRLAHARLAQDDLEHERAVSGVVRHRTRPSRRLGRGGSPSAPPRPVPVREKVYLPSRSRAGGTGACWSSVVTSPMLGGAGACWSSVVTSGSSLLGGVGACWS